MNTEVKIFVPNQVGQHEFLCPLKNCYEMATLYDQLGGHVITCGECARYIGHDFIVTTKKDIHQVLTVQCAPLDKAERIVVGKRAVLVEQGNRSLADIKELVL